MTQVKISGFPAGFFISPTITSNANPSLISDHLHNLLNKHIRSEIEEYNLKCLALGNVNYPATKIKRLESELKVTRGKLENSLVLQISPIASKLRQLLMVYDRCPSADTNEACHKTYLQLQSLAKEIYDKANEYENKTVKTHRIKAHNIIMKCVNDFTQKWRVLQQKHTHPSLSNVENPADQSLTKSLSCTPTMRGG